MQIHELNHYSGDLDQNSFIAIDNGTDTGKLSASELLADVNNDISDLDTTLNARIDNIIAGGAAPSEAEIIDARLGASALGSIPYNSLGDAIRGQVTALKDDTDNETQRMRDALFVNPCPNLLNTLPVVNHDLYNNNGVVASSAIYRTVYFPIDPSINEYVTAEKIAGKIFRMFTTATEPAVGVTVIDHTDDVNTNSVIDIQMSNTARWLGVVYWRSDTDTITKEEMLASLNVFYGQVDNNLTYAEEMDETVNKLDSYFVRHKSANLFDKEDTVDGKYMDRSGSPVNNNNYFYSYVKIDGTGTYRFLGASTLFGTSKVLSIPCFTSDKTYINYITGSHWGSGTGNQYGVEFTITQAMLNAGTVYVAITQHLNNKDSLMVVKDISYPNTYVPYYDYIELTGVTVGNVANAMLNPLYQKQALFFGDSICNGSSAGDGKDGYAGRIGTKNSMDWHNYGYNGATITTIDGHHSISADVVAAYSSYPDPDYIILEGGTNDADNLHEEGLGTYSESDYSGSYDTATFSGAFETMLYNAVQQWPHAQIGYIAGHKMGNGTNLERRRMFFVRAMALCEKWGVPFIDLYTETKLNRSLSAQYDSEMSSAENIAAGHLYTDGQHLTPDGYDLITPPIEWWMCGL